MEKENALKILRELHDKALFSERIALETLIPELKESEDERIRKALIDFMTIMWGNQQDDICGVNVEDAIAWLEKQGNPTDINPSEFDLRLNKLLKQFETLPKEELVSSLSFYLNVVQNDGTYKSDEKQGEQKPWSEEDQNALEDVREAVVHYWGGDSQDILLYWLKSIKQKIKGE